MDPGAPENFVGHPVADARKMVLHEQHCFDGRAAAALQKSRRAFVGELFGEHAGRERIPPGGRLGALVQTNAAKMPFVLKNERAAGLAKDEVIVFTRSFLGAGLAAQFAAHAQMNAQPEVGRKVEKHLFAASLGIEQALTGQELPQEISISVAEHADFGASDEHFQHGMVQTGIPLAAAVFDFGEFRHGERGKCRLESVRRKNRTISLRLPVGAIIFVGFPQHARVAQR